MVNELRRYQFIFWNPKDSVYLEGASEPINIIDLDCLFAFFWGIRPGLSLWKHSFVCYRIGPFELRVWDRGARPLEFSKKVKK